MCVLVCFGHILRVQQYWEKMTEERKLGGKEYRQFQMLDIKEENVAVCLVEVRE